jgi:hypothetical protein
LALLLMKKHSHIIQKTFSQNKKAGKNLLFYFSVSATRLNRKV